MNARLPIDDRRMPRVTRIARGLALLALVAPGLSQADVVTDWNTISNTTAAAAGGPPIQARINAISHLAMHDALNSIQPRYQTYAGLKQPAAGASYQAAAATAAYRALTATVPTKAAELLDIYDSYMADASKVPACPPAYPNCIADGIALGTATASAILAKRAGDGSATPHAPAYTPVSSAPGVYQQTPGSPVPQFTGWGKLKPFVLNHARQFRPWSPLLDLGSETYLRDYLEVQAVGSAAVRTAALSGADPAERSKSLSTSFWARSGGNANSLARAVLEGRGLDPWQHARVLALINMAATDATIVLFDAKYTYNFWRPVTAINVTEDPAWTPYLSPTPPYPDYPSGLSAMVASVTGVLRLYFKRDDLAFSMQGTDFANNPNPRSFASLSAAEHDAAMSRVYGGIHFRTACMDSLRMGSQIARFAFQHELKPL